MRLNSGAKSWLLLVSTLAIHVIDEATTGFLPFYNSMVERFRERWVFFPFPIFSFGLWLGGLVVVLGLGFVLTPWIGRGGRLQRAVMALVGVLMVGNALAHLLGSVYFGRILPGALSAPLLLVGASWVVLRGVRG